MSYRTGDVLKLKPHNVCVERRQVTLNSAQKICARPLQGGCYAAIAGQCTSIKVFAV